MGDSRAEIFHTLHAGPQILVLPNAWDAASAALMEDAGAPNVVRIRSDDGRFSHG